MNKFILNTTFVTERALQDKLTSWLEGVYLKAAENTGLFTGRRMVQVLTDDNPEAFSIACELQCESLSEAVRWHDDTASLLRQDMTNRWGERVLWFTTYLRVI